VQQPDNEAYRRDKPGEFDKNFKDGPGSAEKYGVLEQYKVLNGGVLIALDGVSFFGKSAVRTLSAPDEERENGLSPQHDGGGYSAPRRGCGAASGA
jgi:hypothetical protein